MSFVIVNDRDEYFGWVSVSVDEFDNVCARHATWLRDWSSAKTWETRRAAERALRRIQGLTLDRCAVVGGEATS